MFYKISQIYDISVYTYTYIYIIETYLFENRFLNVMIYIPFEMEESCNEYWYHSFIFHPPSVPVIIFLNLFILVFYVYTISGRKSARIITLNFQILLVLFGFMFNKIFNLRY